MSLPVIHHKLSSSCLAAIRMSHDEEFKRYQLSGYIEGVGNSFDATFVFVYIVRLSFSQTHLLRRSDFAEITGNTLCPTIGIA